MHQAHESCGSDRQRSEQYCRLAGAHESIQPEHLTLSVAFRRQSLAFYEDISLVPAVYVIENLRLRCMRLVCSRNRIGQRVTPWKAVILKTQGMTGNVTCVCLSSVSIFVFGREISAPTSARLRLRHVPLSRPCVVIAACASFHPPLSIVSLSCLPGDGVYRVCCAKSDAHHSSWISKRDHAELSAMTWPLCDWHRRRVRVYAPGKREKSDEKKKRYMIKGRMHAKS